MNTTLFSLLSLTLAFGALVLWAYWPSRRGRLESLGHIPLETDDWMSAENLAQSISDKEDGTH